MKTIKIAHLYYDLMNLYGENGNVRALEKYLSKSFKVETYNLTINDYIDFSKYDIYYIGSGNNESFNLVLNDIIKYEENIKKVIDKKFFLVTGNSINLFGKYYTNKDKRQKCLGVLNYNSKEKKKRIVGEQILKFKKTNEDIIGFYNRSSKLKNIHEKKLFDVVDGYKTFEGIKHKNFYGTYLLGPILIRNPHFTEYLVQKICKQQNVSYKQIDNTLELNAYKQYKNNFLKK